MPHTLHTRWWSFTAPCQTVGLEGLASDPRGSRGVAPKRVGIAGYNVVSEAPVTSTEVMVHPSAFLVAGEEDSPGKQVNSPGSEVSLPGAEVRAQCGEVAVAGHEDVPVEDDGFEAAEAAARHGAAHL
eukprot:9361946-Pyramimonas_sp.AAC.2